MLGCLRPYRIGRGKWSRELLTFLELDYKRHNGIENNHRGANQRYGVWQLGKQ